MIELIVVIVILGILAATATAQYVNLREDAALAQAKGIAASYRTAATTVQMAFQAKGFTTRTQNLPGVAGDVIDTNNNGLPIGIAKGNGNENIGPGVNGCVGLWNTLLVDPPAVAAGNNNQDYRAYRHDAGRVCSYAYRAAGDTAGRANARIVVRYDSRNGEVIVCGTHPGVAGC